MSRSHDIEQLMDCACPAFSCEWKGSADMCSRTSLLPNNIERVEEVALAAKRLLPMEFANGGHGIAPRAGQQSHAGHVGGVGQQGCAGQQGRSFMPEKKKAIIAAFDFDGTCISASSPTRLVGVLGKSFQLNPWKLFRVGLWALAYKLNFPYKDPIAVRERVFTAFKGESAVKVNDFLCRFYHEKVAPYFRTAADAEMMTHLKAGHVVIVVSASFEPIIAAAMVDHPIQFSISSRMKIDANGDYTNEVDGLPVEGPDKMIVLREFADRYFGVGNWEIGWAYGDHYSDLDMLEAAAHPCAVTPDSKLERTALERGWEILDWD